jgi:excisionase family DNA binding protein
MSEFLNARQMAERLHVTPATVLSWARRGRIPCLRASRRPVLFDAADVERLLRERAEQVREHQ